MSSGQSETLEIKIHGGAIEARARTTLSPNCVGNVETRRSTARPAIFFLEATVLRQAALWRCSCLPSP